MLPNFLIVGAEKSGTTSLWSYLAEHPDVYMAPKKEIKFFDRRYAIGIDAYEAYFLGWKGETAVGEATQTYLYLPQAPERILHHMPQAKLIFTLRNPIDRAYSHYWHAVTRGDEYLSFEKALEREQERLQRHPYCRRVFSYRDRSRYYEQVKRYTDLFPRTQLLFLLFEDLTASSEVVLQEVCEFLGVRGETGARRPLRRANAGHYPRSLALQKAANFLLYHARMTAYDYLPPRRAEGFRFLLKPLVVAPLRRINLERRNYPDMDKETRRRLVEELREDNHRLEQLIGKDLSRWNS